MSANPVVKGLFYEDYHKILRLIDQFKRDLDSSFSWNDRIENNLNTIYSKFEQLSQQFDGVYSNYKNYIHQKKWDITYIEDLKKEMVWINRLQKSRIAPQKHEESCIVQSARYLVIAIVAVAIYKYNYPCGK